jgi:hypothetical protein
MIQNEMEKITMTGEDGSSLSFFVLEQTKFLGKNYLLVTETPEEDEVFLLKEVQTQEEEAVYVFVEDEQELSAVSELFEELLEDTGIEIDE